MPPLRAAERRASRSGARRLLRGSHPRCGRRTFPRGKRGAHRTRDRSPCGGDEWGNPFALAAARFPTREAGDLDHQGPGTGKRFARPSCERARVGCSSGRARASYQVAEVDEQHQTATTRIALEAKRVHGGLATPPPPISRVPKGRGEKDGGSGPARAGKRPGGNERPTRGWRRGCWLGAGDASPEPSTSCGAPLSRVGRRARPAAGEPRVREVVVVDGRRFGSWTPIRGHARVGESGLGPLGARLRTGESGSPRASGVRGRMTAERQRLGPRAPVGRERRSESTRARRSGSVVVKRSIPRSSSRRVSRGARSGEGNAGAPGSGVRGRHSRRDPARHGCTVDDGVDGRRRGHAS
jgi:hypothetical protein